MPSRFELQARLCAGALAVSLLAGGAQAQTPAAATSPAGLSRAEAQAILRDARKVPQPQGIEELRTVELGGVKQWISVRGRDRRNPILLFIHGGPGTPEMPVSWSYQRPWEDYFTVVQWDQRGAGKTAAANDPAAIAPSITVERMTQDGEELVAHLRKTYGKRKIFILGHSWGTVIGLKLAERHPDWLHAYIGMGQVIYGVDNERLGYEFALRQARAHGDQDATRELEAIAPYPGLPGSLSIAKIITQRKWVIHFGGLTWGRGDFDYEENLRKLSPDYTETDLQADGEGATLMRLLPDLQRLDFREVKRLDCPTFLFAGRYDYETPSQVAAAWLENLKAPEKRIFWFERSAHMMQQEQPGTLLLHLVRDVRPLAVRAGDAAPEDRPGAGG
jgi:proline iminopeptidase